MGNCCAVNAKPQKNDLKIATGRDELEKRYKIDEDEMAAGKFG